MGRPRMTLSFIFVDRFNNEKVRNLAFLLKRLRKVSSILQNLIKWKNRTFVLVFMTVS